jgi:hypothetical protein
MQPRDDDIRGPEQAPEAPSQEPRPRRFRIVKLEERIAPQATVPSKWCNPATSCANSTSVC